MSRTLPHWSSVLAVVAHPDDESFGLGAVLAGLVQAGAEVAVLCFTRGEASTIHGVEGELAELRELELQNAAAELGVRSSTLLAHPDGALGTVDADELADEVARAASGMSADALVVFDDSGVTGHPDHRAATAAAVRAARRLGIPVLAWTLPRTVAEQLNREYAASFHGHDEAEIDLVVDVSRDRQRVAALAHASQAIPTSVLWRRLELLGDEEHLRWL